MSSSNNLNKHKSNQARPAPAHAFEMWSHMTRTNYPNDQAGR